MCRFIYQLNLSGTQKQDILIEFYLMAFNFNIESDISLLFKDIDLRPFNTQKEEIEGCTAAITNKKEKTEDQIFYEQNQNYASEITSRIKLLNAFNYTSRTLLIQPLKLNNYGHDFYILGPKNKNSIRQLFAIQVVTRSKDKYLSKSDGYKIEKGYDICEKMKNFLPNIHIEYIFLSNLETNISFEYITDDKFHIFKDELLSKLMERETQKE